jgi:hypothetical protein
LIVTANVTVADCPGASVPPAVDDAPAPSRATITPDSFATVPAPALTLGAGVVMVVPAGSGSLNCTFVASPVPLLVAVIVYVMVAPGSALEAPVEAVYVSVTFGENNSVANVIACGA